MPYVLVNLKRNEALGGKKFGGFCVMGTRKEARYLAKCNPGYNAWNGKKIIK